MAKGQSRVSRTAEYMALFRALESSRRPEQRLFEDPFALAFLGPSLRAIYYLSRFPALGTIVPWFIDQRWPGARSSGIARTRLIDDLLTIALEDGVQQVVLLGAGFDCRAYRLRCLEHSHVFEVDRPDTIALKRQRLLRMLGSPPPHVVFVGIDFNQQGLEMAMQESGFEPARRSIFVWEGVTNYLTEQAVDTTLRFIADSAPGGQVLFTYVHRGVIDNPANFAGTKELARTLERSGEPWTFGLYPSDLPGFLRARGLRLLSDLGSVEYRARYMSVRDLPLQGYEFYRVALAEVGG